MGGLDNSENIVELTIEEHADAHKILYEKYGKIEDYWAWKGLSGQIGKEDLIKEINLFNGKKVFENKLGIFSMTVEEKKQACIKGGKTSGIKNAKSGHCKNIAHLGGKSASGMTFWFNSKTGEETKSFECPGEDWSTGVKMERVNIENLRKQSSNRKDSFWIHDPDTGETKMILQGHEIPEGFIPGRKLEIKNTLELLNVGDNSYLDLKRIKSEFNEIHFDNSYKRWVFTFRINDQKNKITHIDYWTLVWSRDSIINFYNLGLVKSDINFPDSFSKEEVINILKSFREYLKTEKILEGKLKKSKREFYNKKLSLYKEKYDFLLKKRNDLDN
jgi:hypothetical protein